MKKFAPGMLHAKETHNVMMRSISMLVSIIVITAAVLAAISAAASAQVSDASVIGHAPSSAYNSSKPQIGTVIGSLVSTDITAWINGEPIRSMNSFGKTAIVAEDLRSFGFDVSWNPLDRVVTIYPSLNKPVNPPPVPNPDQNNQPIGTKIGDIVVTNIRTVIEGKEIPSFNIGGRTVIWFQDLAPLGDVVWDEKERRVSFTGGHAVPADPREARITAHSSAFPLQIEQLSSHNFTIRFTDDGLYDGGKKIGFGVDGRAMLSLRWMAATLNYRLEKEKDGALSTDNGTYGFRIHPKDGTVGLYWFGTFQNEDKLTAAPIEQGDDLYVYEYDLKELFGYTGFWDGEDRSLYINYPRYEVHDFGISESAEHSAYHLQGLLYAPLFGDLPQLDVHNTRAANGSSDTVLTDETIPVDAPIYQFNASVPLEKGDNQLTVVYHMKKRILYAKSLTFVQ